MDYLEIAKEKFFTNNKLPAHIWRRDLDVFVCANFKHCDPSSRGIKFVKKLLIDNKKIENVINRIKRGDVKINETYYEVKNPYLIRDSNSFRITNIRPWQNYSKFIICLIDCVDNFKSNFFVVNKNDLLLHPDIKLHNQHTDANDDKHNQKANMVIELERIVMFNILKSLTLLNGQTYDDFKEYVNDNQNMIPVNPKLNYEQLSLEF